LSSIFSPDERVILSGKGSLEQPVTGKGELYLTDKRLFLVHKSGLITKRETPLVDIKISEVNYVKVEGSIRKVLVLGVRGTGGMIVAYKIHISAPEAWSAQIYSLKGGSVVSMPATVQAAPTLVVQPGFSGSKFCTSCGQQVKLDAKFCSGCGGPTS
jgi:hypothetical protein